MTRTLPGLDLETFETWLRAERPDLLGSAPLQARLITGGLSNLSFAITGGAQPWVLRRPPLGHVLSTAHDMGREFRIIRALADTDVPVPVAHLHHHDVDGRAGVGAEFYLMDFVDGVVLNSREGNAAFSREQLRMLGPQLGEVLARLHSVPWRSIGLDDFGRPDGFLTRQVSRWRRQLDSSRSRDLPQLDDLFEAVAQAVPETSRVSIVHGDFRLDNALITVDSGRPVVSAVLDWEMCTIGDSFTDLGLLAVYWNMHEVPGAEGSPLASAIDPAAGYSSFDEIVDAYAAARGIPVPDLSWYAAFASFKLAVILEGIHYRFTQGQTVGDGFDAVGRLVAGVADGGLNFLR
ncbi:phosphotransferase family protein [soil metagenome]